MADPPSSSGTDAVCIVPFTSGFQDQVVDLIVGIQRGEFAIDITAEQQPDLREIRTFYQRDAGNFWIALEEGRVVGTISLLDIGDGQAALRKMFVHPDFRGRERGTAQALLRTLLDWASERSLHEIYLGTTPFFRAAHRFYEKCGFTEISKDRLPPAFPIMEVDTRFYQLRLSDRRAV